MVDVLPRKAPHCLSKATSQIGAVELERVHAVADVGDRLLDVEAWQVFPGRRGGSLGHDDVLSKEGAVCLDALTGGAHEEEGHCAEIVNLFWLNKDEEDHPHQHTDS